MLKITRLKKPYSEKPYLEKSCIEKNRNNIKSVGFYMVLCSVLLPIQIVNAEVDSNGNQGPLLEQEYVQRVLDSETLNNNELTQASDNQASDNNDIQLNLNHETKQLNKTTEKQVSFKKNSETAQTLYEQITSEAYSEKKEIKKPIIKDDNADWITKLFKYFFGDKDEDKKNNSSKTNSSSKEGIGIFPMLVKGLLIILLAILIFYIIKNREDFIGWVSSLKLAGKKNSISVDDYKDAHLYQGWEKLPPHEQIPNVVNELLKQHNAIAAASILYRGGLRWLSTHHNVVIKPATTELQCIQLIQKVYNLPATPQDALTNNTEHNLVTTSAHYMNKVIHSWMHHAYSGKQQSGADTELMNLSNQWLNQLPLQPHTNQSMEEVAI